MISGTNGLSSRVVENVFLYIAAISVFLLALITFLMVYFVFRYHHRRNPVPENIEGSTWLEITWTIVPTLLVMTMFYYGYVGFQSLKKVPEGAMKIKVVARQWSWLFEYENGLKETELKVPLETPVVLSLTSQDVIHSFYIPAFKIKQDAVPGMETRLWFKSTAPGEYDVLCAEYCGLRHSYMLTKVVVLPKQEFQKWYEAKVREKEVAKAGPRGVQLFEEKGCKACHSVDGTPLLGPTLKGLFGKTITVLTEGKERQIKADEDYLRKSILEPSADVAKGYPPIMPPQQIAENEVDEIVNYLKELK